MKVSKALEGFNILRSAEGASPSTIQAYHWGLEILMLFLGDPEVETITTEDLMRWFSYLRTNTKLTEASIQVAWRVMRAFFDWASETLHFQRPDLTIKRPRAVSRAIRPLDEDEVQRLLKSCDYSTPAATDDRKTFQMKRPTSKRDKALILFLLDTGLRISECARLHIEDVDMEKGEVQIRPYLSGAKSRARLVYIGKMVKKALWMYISERDNPDGDAPLFVTEADKPMDRDSLRKLLVRMGIRAGVKNVHPHRLRHTFAIQYLRNGGDVFSLQRLLGHNSLSMVKIYLQLADTDAQNAHKRASPADRWHL